VWDSLRPLQSHFECDGATERVTNDVRSCDVQPIEKRPQQRRKIRNAAAVAKRTAVSAAWKIWHDDAIPSLECANLQSPIGSARSEPVYEK
jgi:hypothetical protein